ncbi:ABC transporter ATP-binding protein [Mycobacterium sp. ITM-2016-00317]|uniref:ABC transporter ATP-binding protein n=1 Tax=Mycobacterium sp. ITM-2016-00317 TaxID=2099694 RepID=UPI00287F99FC|nr:ABC transporter ATP-binding protein [Mycobacterium sp. ITM-2016-00317]WNG85864.1 ABC transporter ATP-binding protein [Mycobacterium sp. ITM-2016-00317]
MTTQLDPPLSGGTVNQAARVDIEHVSLAFETKRSGRVQALEDFSLTIEPGTFCCIVGPSGCGKSTLLRIIDGLQKPDDGRVLINDKVVEKPTLDVGFVFQKYNLLPWRSVLANVEFGLENLGVPKDKRRQIAQRWMKIVGLQGFEEHYPAQLSGGMQQRVGLIRALAIDPKILLMDEPFGAVDDLTRMKLQEELLNLWERDNKTVVFVTHDIEEALYLADRVIVMSARPGRISEIFDVDLPRPRNPEIRALPEFAKLKGEVLKCLHMTGAIGQDGE